jgi:hypothetical protein
LLALSVWGLNVSAIKLDLVENDKWRCEFWLCIFLNTYYISATDSLTSFLGTPKQWIKFTRASWDILTLEAKHKPVSVGYYIKY